MLTLMSYELKFKEQALREWKKLAETTREIFKKKLLERLVQPRVASSKLRGLKNCYKIKLRQSGSSMRCVITNLL